VSQYVGPLDESLADVALVIEVKIGTTDTHSPDPDQDFVGRGCGTREFLDTQISNLVENRCLHGGVNPLFLDQPYPGLLTDVGGRWFAKQTRGKLPGTVEHVKGWRGSPVKGC
jgi:hypothetical protein